MEERLMAIPDGYDGNTQLMVATFAAQLEAQYEKLKKAVEGMTVEQLEWQLHPGMNTIGMLLAHIAIAEIFWINIAPVEIHDENEWDRIIKDLIGILGHEDGMPLPKDGKHPESLAGKSLDQYMSMLDTARATTGKILRSWNDENIEATFAVEDKYRFSRTWALYHILEHLSGHLGQVLILKHLMRDKGVLS